jgi:hypothetical protein
MLSMLRDLSLISDIEDDEATTIVGAAAAPAQDTANDIFEIVPSPTYAQQTAQQAAIEQAQQFVGPPAPNAAVVPAPQVAMTPAEQQAWLAQQQQQYQAVYGTPAQQAAQAAAAQKAVAAGISPFAVPGATAVAAKPAGPGILQQIAALFGGTAAATPTATALQQAFGVKPPVAAPKKTDNTWLIAGGIGVAVLAVVVVLATRK